MNDAPGTPLTVRRIPGLRPGHCLLTRRDTVMPISRGFSAVLAKPCAAAQCTRMLGGGVLRKTT